MMYATFNDDGFPTGFYSEDVHGARMLPVYGPATEPTEEDPSPEPPIIGEQPNPLSMIPAEAIEISHADWREFLAHPGMRKWDGTQPVEYVPPPPVPTGADVDAERDHRLAAGFDFGGTTYQARPGDIININGAATAALNAILAGKQAGDLRWADPDVDFTWIAADNSRTPMDAQTVILFGQAAMARVTALTMAGRAIKDRLLAGETLDIADDALWAAAEA